MADYIFQRVTPAHYPLLTELYLNAFHTVSAVEDITRRFDTAALGCEHVGFIALTSTNRPAAYYGVFPVTLKKGEEKILSAQSGDTMTHSEHRMKGLFVQLARLTFDECRKMNIRLVFGFPNENSFPGFINKLDWRQIDSIVRYDLKLRIKTFPTPKLAARWRWLLKPYRWYARQVLAKKIANNITSFDNLVQSDHPRVDRSSAYLRYKETSDKFFIRVGEVICWIKLTDVLWLGDINDYSKLDIAVFKKLRRLAFWLGYNTISFHINETVQLPAAFAGFKKYNAEPSCMLPLETNSSVQNILFTAADFDTW